MRRLRREMCPLRHEMRRLRREMRRLRREMLRLRRKMRQLRREMCRLRHECVDCVMECVDCVVECVDCVVKCVDCVSTSCIFRVTSDLIHWPNIDLWPHYIFMIMQIRPHPSLIFINPHEYSAPPFSCMTLHPSRDVTSQVTFSPPVDFYNLICINPTKFELDTPPGTENTAFFLRKKCFPRQK